MAHQMALEEQQNRRGLLGNILGGVATLGITAVAGAYLWPGAAAVVPTLVGGVLQS